MSHADQLIRKATERDVLFGVVGLGYVGLPLAYELVRAGYRVLGYDINERVVSGLMSGRSHIKDISDAQLAEMLKDKRFVATTDAGRLRLANELLRRAEGTRDRVEAARWRDEVTRLKPEPKPEFK